MTKRSNRGKGKNTMAAILGLLTDPLNLLEILSATVISGMLKYIDENLLDVVRKSVPGDQQVDEAYVNRFACAVYLVAIDAPYEVFVEAGGVVNYAWNFMLKFPDEVSPERLLGIFHDGFARYSPTMANAITMDTLLKTGKLLLMDWIEAGGSPSEEQIQNDVHFYFDEVLELEGNLDHDAMRQDGLKHLDSLTPEELAEFPADLLKRMEQFRKDSQTAE